MRKEYLPTFFYLKWVSTYLLTFTLSGYLPTYFYLKRVPTYLLIRYSEEVGT
jgi:hypothetical protein